MASVAFSPEPERGRMILPIAGWNSSSTGVSIGDDELKDDIYCRDYKDNEREKTLAYREHPVVKDPWKIPFGIQHYFLGFLQPLLEQTIHEFIKTLSGSVYDMLGQAYASGQLTYGKFAELKEKSWQDDNVDLSDCALLLKTSYSYIARSQGLNVGGKLYYEVLDACDHVRQCYIHRQEQVSFSSLEKALTLPQVLGVSRNEEEFSHASYYLSCPDSDDLESQVKDSFHSVAFGRYSSSRTDHQVLHKVLTILLQALFAFAREENLAMLRDNGWYRAEQVEISKWRDEFRECPDNMPSDKWDTLRSIVDDACSLRNCVAHRGPLGVKMERYLGHASMLALSIQKPVRAAEIEIVTEQWLSKESRATVLTRLARSSPREDSWLSYSEKQKAERDTAVRMLLDEDRALQDGTYKKRRYSNSSFSASWKSELDSEDDLRWSISTPDLSTDGSDQSEG